MDFPGGAGLKLSKEEDFEIEVRLLLEAIFQKFNHDFRKYAFSSVKRRVAHALQQMEFPTVSNLQENLFHDPKCFGRLLQYLTIATSEMFRDPEYYVALRTKVFPLLHTYPSLKVWVAGCSTGEELYSLAICLKEEGLLERTILYATDINPVSLKRAEEGIFSLEDIQKYSESYELAGGKSLLSDYYTAAYDYVAFDKDLIRSVVFADHSLATDHVFSETHLISCRNVLIYFNAELQDRALSLFYESLCHGGFLGLGSKESLQFSKYANCFEIVDRTAKVFQKQ